MDIHRVFVIGGGTMGNGIAQVCAQSGLAVTLNDISSDVLNRAVSTIGKSVSKFVFIVEKGTPGFSVARKLNKVGNWAAETGELVFEDCRVPAKNMIGEREGGGFDQIADTLMSGRITYGARCTGTAQAAYELTMKYAAERIQFGQPIIKYQNTKFKLAEIATNIEIMCTFTYRIAWEHMPPSARSARF